jgi:hypothetical protein
MSNTKAIKLNLKLAVSSLLVLGSFLFVAPTYAETMNEANVIYKTILPSDPSVSNKTIG